MTQSPSLWHIGAARGDDGRTIRDEAGAQVAREASRTAARRLVKRHNAKVPAVPGSVAK